jgi:hypothetical protein
MYAPALNHWHALHVIRMMRADVLCVSMACAVIIHHGAGMSVGHYTTIVRSALTNQWLHIGDDEVEVMPEREVAASEAYLLFYTLQPTADISCTTTVAAPAVAQQSTAPTIKPMPAAQSNVPATKAAKSSNATKQASPTAVSAVPGGELAVSRKKVKKRR